MFVKLVYMELNFGVILRRRLNLLEWSSKLSVSGWLILDPKQVLVDSSARPY